MKLRPQTQRALSKFAHRFGFINRRSVMLAAALFVVAAGLVGVFQAIRPPSLSISTAQSPDESSNVSTSFHAHAATSGRAASNQVTDTSISPDVTTNHAQTPHKTLVHVDGAVVNPGVVELEVADPRVQNALDACGGLTNDADTTSINLAAIVADGTKVYIPRQGEQPPVALQPAPQSTSGQSVPSANASQQAADAIVNLNTATAEELQTLPGVGASTAQKIIQDRASHGPFSSPEDLMRVSGIGQKKFDKLKDKICVLSGRHTPASVSTSDALHILGRSAYRGTHSLCCSVVPSCSRTRVHSALHPYMFYSDEKSRFSVSRLSLCDSGWCCLSTCCTTAACTPGEGP